MSLSPLGTLRLTDAGGSTDLFGVRQLKVPDGGLSQPASGVGTFSWLVPSNNLSDLTDASAARMSLGLGTLATLSAAPAGTLTGTTLASGVTASSLATVGTLTGGATGAGFTVALGTSTVTGVLGAANGGTANGFTAFTGPATATRTFTLPNADATVLTTNAAVTPTQGGTGTGTYALGDTLYSDATNSLAKLAGNTTATRKFLRQTGNGAASAAPAWDTVTKADVGLGSVENTALSTWAGSANVTTLGTVGTGTWNAGAVTAAGDLTLSGTARRVLGDFSNATVASRVLFRTSTLNDATRVGAYPNGSSTVSEFACYDGADPDNAALVRITAVGSSSLVGLESAKTGSGTLRPLSFLINSSVKWQVSTAGDLEAATTGLRIRGDLSNATVANRLAFQNSVTNGQSTLFVIPNGTSTSASVLCAANSTPTNAAYCQIGHLGTVAFVASGALGSGTATGLELRIGATAYLTIDTSGNVALNAGTLSGFKVAQNTQSGTTYTMAAGDTGKVVEFTSASAVTVTLPNNLAVGWTCTVVQRGAGQVSFSAAAGASLNNRSSQTKTAGQYAVVSLYVPANSGGSAAVYNLSGDTGA